jgi:oligoribonuclease NrnB/cAMP/cGMP phosphodiesterase (DHH superfamily)
MKATCFFHAGCPDGFGAAWAVWRAWGARGRYRPCGHEDGLDAREFAGAHVVFVDIAPDNATLHDLAEFAERVVVLDHHLSSRDRYTADPGLAKRLSAGPHRVHYDLDRSGAVLAWQHFHPDESTPMLLRYVEDQDLWSWKLPQSREVNAAIASYRRNFEVWDGLAARPIEELAAEGAPIARANRVEVERMLKAAHPLRIGGGRAEAVNAQHHRSAIGHALAKRAAYGPPWGVVYRLGGKRLDVSIYSIGDLDVSKIATEHGGGGHRNAAGFSVSLEEWLKRFA